VVERSQRNALVVENLALVGYLVSETWAKARHLSRDDLASAGALALITSADSFRPELGIPFGAFARRRILGAFADEMRSSDWATRGARRRIKETLAVHDTFTAAMGRKPTVDEVASALGVDRESAAAGMADAARVVVDLDATVAGALVAQDALPEETLLSSERLLYLSAAVSALPERMRAIVQAIYFDDKTVKEVAEESGITHSAVSQLRSEAVRLLRDGLETHYSDSTVPHTPVSRIAASSRSAYLARVAEHAMSTSARDRGNVTTEAVAS
jgi:RNA polymerase sigma factor for flagellar operon FliA